MSGENSSDVSVVGLERLNSTAHAAADELRHLESTNHRAAQLVLDRASPPRVTGALGESGQVEADDEGATVIYGAIYAGVIHGGWADHNIEAQPWLADEFDRSTSDITNTYVDGVVDVLNHIDGA